MEWSFPRDAARRRSGRALSITALIALAGLGLAGCTPAPGGDAAASLSGEANTSAGPSTAEHSVVTESTTLRNLLPVYWLGDNDGSIQLYREFLDGGKGGDPIAAAVQAMTANSPTDPDYFGSWSPAESVSASISPDNVITVDISADAFNTPLDQGAAYRAIQQLVYTATAAASNAGLVSGGDPSRVVVLVDGAAGYTAFGHIELGGQLQRDATLMAPIWIIEPQQGAVRDQPTITVSGSGRTENAVLHWRIDEVTGDELESYRSGTVGLEASTSSPGLFEFTIALVPGEYEISVFDRPQAGQENRELDTDTKRVVVQ
ncbi:GerMN domain-containing protein [Arthrobacter flavus]|uniref:GerMN domain-containing protein n=1 Tax=Arthrobacter flavus TaxID=95172 RepID=A0ABW4QCH3_9MICC